MPLSFVSRRIAGVATFFRSLMQRRTIFLGALIAIVLVATAPFVWNKWEEHNGGRKVIVGDTHLVAEKEDRAGVDVQSRFFLTIKSGIDLPAIRENLSVSPLANFDVNRKDGQTAEIVFSRPLKGNTVYVFRLKSVVSRSGAVQAASEESSFTWAFQTKETFQIMATTPANKSTDVPVDAGIEIVFSHAQIKNLESHFSIEPSVEGRFEYSNKTAIFVPKTMQPKTVYTVTIRSGVISKEHPDALSDDSTFRFETGDSSISDTARKRPLELTGNSSYEGSIQEFNTRVAPVFSVISGSDEVDGKKFFVEVYRFDALDDFLKMVRERDESLERSGWSHHSKHYRFDTTTLQKVGSFEAEAEKYGWKSIVVFPEPLNAGWYVFDATPQAGGSSERQQLAFQVTDIAAYAASGIGKGFLWLNDASATAPLTGAQAELISLNGKAKTIGSQSGVDGLLNFGNVDMSFGDVFAEKEDDVPRLIRVTDAQKRTLLLPVVRETQSLPLSDMYWAYLYVDRTQYQPTDTVKFWGIVRERNKEKPEKLRLRLLVDGGTRYEQTIETSENGTVIGEIPMNNWQGSEYGSASYRLSLASAEGEYEGEDIASRYFFVMEYDKKSYKIDAASNRKGYFSGEKAVFSGNVGYYDGTRIPRRELECQLNSQVVTTESDQNGSFSCALGVDWTNGVGSWNMSVRPTGAETSEINGYASVSVVPGSVGLSLETEKHDEKIRLVARTYAFDMSRFNTDDDYLYRDYPIGGKSVSVSITEIYFEKKEKGERYDFIEKRSVKEYEYERKTRDIGTFDITTDGVGTGFLDGKFDTGKQYEVTASVKDEDGRIWNASQYVFGESLNYETDENAILMRSGKEDDADDAYALGESVRMTIARYGGPIDSREGQRMLFYRAQGGIVDMAVGNEPEYEFAYSQADMPNSDVTGVWWDGKIYRSVSRSVLFNKKTRELDVQVRSDAKEYRPRQEALLNVEVKDASGKAVKDAVVNINVVDDAAGGTAEPMLESLYSYKSPGITMPYISHVYPEKEMAERGGCFASGTLVRMADGTEKSIESVREGEEILSRESIFSAVPVVSTVIKTHKHRVQGYLAVNDRLRVTPEHILWVNGTWKQAREIRIGDTLLDSSGALHEIRSITNVREWTDVYNLTIDGTHTYFASDMYVHNCKDGDCGRMLFPDHIFFGEAQTDDAGKATVSFSLPDSVTAWDVRAQSISRDTFFGSASAKLPVSLPFFTDLDVATEYLEGDEPEVAIRSFGNALKGDEKVTYVFSAPTVGGVEGTLDSRAFETAYWRLGALPQGEHLLTVDAVSGGLRDRITKKIRVAKTRVSRKTATSLELDPKTRVPGSDNGETRLIVSDGTTHFLLALLEDLREQDSIRMDAAIARIEAAKILNQKFQEENEIEDYSREKFQKEDDGGIALVSYGGSDLFASYLVALLGRDEYFSRGKLIGYFQKIAYDAKTTPEDVSVALAGLAALREPVLLDVRAMLNDDNVKTRDAILLATGLAAMGDETAARLTAREVIESPMTRKSPDGAWSIDFPEQKSKDDVLSDTAIMADLCALSGLTNEAERYGLFLTANRGHAMPFYLDKVILADKLSKNAIVGTEKTFFYSLDGASKKKTLMPGEVFEIFLDMKQRGHFRFESSDVGLHAMASFNEKPSVDFSFSDEATIQREYFVGGKRTTELSEGDIVKVRLSYVLSSKASDGCYQVTDYLPSGLRFLSARSYGSERLSGIAPEQLNSNKAGFCARIVDREKYAEYFARVSGKGVFVAEGPTIQSSVQVVEWKQFDSDRLTVR